MRLSVEGAHVVPRIRQAELAHRDEDEGVESEAGRRAATSSESRPSPTTVRASMRGASDAINPSTSSRVAMPRATVTPVSPQSARPAIEIGTSTTTPASASGISNRVRCMTNRSGYVIENAAFATIHGDRNTTWRPRSFPTSPEYASPSTAVTTRPPMSATSPAAPPTSASETQAEWTTCSAAVSAFTPRRVNVAAEISEREKAVALTNIPASRYAYERLVTFPSPVPAAKRSATT